MKSFDRLERSRLITARKQIEKGTITTKDFQKAISGIGGNDGNMSISDPDLAFLKEFTKAEKDLWEARTRFSSSSLMVSGLEARLNQLQPQFRVKQLEIIDRALNLNNQRLSSTNDQIDALKTKFPARLELIRQFDTLNGKLNIAKENLAGLIRARETFQLEIAQSAVPWRVIVPPV